MSSNQTFVYCCLGIFFSLLTSCRYDYISNPSYQLTVVNGLGSGQYEAGQIVSISAQGSSPGLAFSYWGGDSLLLDSYLDPQADLLMPERDVSVIAYFEDTTSYQLRVISGQGSGLYQGGQNVAIQANPADRGYLFSHWEGDTTYLAEPQDSQTILVMPHSEVTVTAVYDELPRFELKVLDGEGSGAYLQGDTIRIEAWTPSAASERFIRWGGASADLLVDFEASSTQLVMPRKAITVRALYRQDTLPTYSYALDVLPIMEKSCYIGCHGPQGNYLDLSTYQAVADNAQGIKSAVVSGFMPALGTLPNYQVTLIVRWVDEGALNN